MARKVTSPGSRLATYSPNGHIWINAEIPRGMRGRVRKHEQTEYRLRKEGMSQHEAHAKALKAEHKGMTRHQVAVYEGTLGAIAKNHQAIHRKR